ncbi:hypothetical protein ACFLQW_03780 [Candidatus Zixiibacteriota bacterium]
MAAGVSVDAHVDLTEITIGDRVNLEVVITADTTLDVVLPDMEILLGVFEVKDYEHAEPVIDETGRRIHRYWYNLTTWTTGRWLIPPLTATFTDSLGRTGSASSDSLFINVKSLLAEAGPDTVDIRDLKPQYEVPADRALFYYLGGALIVVGLALWYLLRRRKVEQRLAEVDLRTPGERAIDDLNDLNNSGYLADGKWREWYFDLTEIYRRYLDGRYDVETLEATTSEIKTLLPDLPFGENEQRQIVDFLDSADWVKFARLVPPEEKPRQDFDWVWQFVQRTKVETIIDEQTTTKTRKTGTDG